MKGEDWLWPMIVLIIIVLVWTKSKTEGVYEEDFITCEKPADSKKWRNAIKGADRWYALSELNYQVSFGHQRVVTELPSALSNCVVFNRNNWACEGGYQVRDGDMHPNCTYLDRPYCRLPVGWFAHSLVYVGGADWMCGNQSSTLDIWYEGAMRLRGQTP